MKSDRDAANCWKSLLVGQYAVDPFQFQNMEKKLTLERFQKEVVIVKHTYIQMASELSSYFKFLVLHNFPLCIMYVYPFLCRIQVLTLVEQKYLVIFQREGRGLISMTNPNLNFPQVILSISKQLSSTDCISPIIKCF